MTVYTVKFMSHFSDFLRKGEVNYEVKDRFMYCFIANTSSESGFKNSTIMFSFDKSASIDGFSITFINFYSFKVLFRAFILYFTIL